MSLYAPLPAHLAGFEAQGLLPQEPIAQFELGNLKNFIYLILDWASRKAAIVDPQRDLKPPLEALAKHGFELTTILLTHTHHDHVAGVDPLLKQMPHLEVRVGEKDLHRLGKAAQAHPQLKIIADGEKFSIGALEILAIHTPGHSAGEMTYFIKPQEGALVPYLLTGDTLFIRDCGRTDFPDGSNEQMFASIQRVKRLPAETVFLVGHHYQRECATTLAAELKASPPFLCRSVQELVSLP